MDIVEYGGFSDPINNAVAEATQRQRQLITTRLFNVIYGEYEIAEGLFAKVSLGVNYAEQSSRQLLPPHYSWY